MQKENHLQYFGEEIPADACCTTLGGTLCDNCKELERDNIQLVSRTQEFSIIADAIIDLPNHGIHKVRQFIIIIVYTVRYSHIDFL